MKFLVITDSDGKRRVKEHDFPTFEKLNSKLIESGINDFRVFCEINELVESLSSRVTAIEQKHIHFEKSLSSINKNDTDLVLDDTDTVFNNKQEESKFIEVELIEKNLVLENEKITKEKNDRSSIEHYGFQVEMFNESENNENIESAIVRNEKGHSFSIYRISKDGTVWGNFSLSDTVSDQLNPDRLPMYRIDNNKATNLDEIAKLGQKYYHAYDLYPKRLSFQIWHGEEGEGISKDIIQMMEGKEMVFNYYLTAGGFNETSFSLKDASATISKAIGIKSKK